MRVHVLNHMRHGIVVHKVGCADVTREKRRMRLNSDWLFDAGDRDIATAVVEDLNESFGWPETYTDPETGKVDEPAPWSTGDIRIMPCVRS